MPLLVVPLAPEQAGLLTLEEYDALASCELVLFEEEGHPLAERLASAGVEVFVLDGEPDPGHSAWALVADPRSKRVVELARRGATVTAGPGTPPDALTAAHGAPVVRSAGAALTDVALIMARLRSEDGCPWDLEQTHESLKVHLLEEAYEVIDSIDRGELTGELEEELGDLLLQVAFHARLAEVEGRFDIADVSRHLVAKLVRRHPHVFGDVSVAGAGEVVANWEQIKRDEKARAGAFEGIPDSLPALLSAYKVQKRAASLGFGADAEAARAWLRAALDGPEITPESLGEALFWVVALARASGVDPEGALRKATTSFKDSLDSPP